MYDVPPHLASTQFTELFSTLISIITLHTRLQDDLLRSVKREHESHIQYTLQQRQLRDQMIYPSQEMDNKNHIKHTSIGFTQVLKKYVQDFKVKKHMYENITCHIMISSDG